MYQRGFGSAIQLGLILLCALSRMATDLSAAEFIPLGDLRGGKFRSTAFRVSDDGNTVIGISVESGSTDVGMVWTPQKGMARIGNGAGPRDVSSDGSIIVGDNNNDLAVIWNPDRVASPLPFSGLASAVSSNGLTVVGATTDHQAHRWSNAGGVELLGHLPGGDWGAARGVSSDGGTVVGYDQRFGVQNAQAFRWTEQGGMAGLGYLPGTASSYANAVSADGSVVVGESYYADSGLSQAFRWTAETGMARLNQGHGSVPPFISSVASATNGDGSIVVGAVERFAYPFIWHATRDMNFLQLVLADEYGLGNSLVGWTLRNAYDISANGRFIVGDGFNPQGDREAWLVRLDDPYGSVPVPEPAGISGSAWAILAFFFRSRRFRG